MVGPIFCVHIIQIDNSTLSLAIISISVLVCFKSNKQAFDISLLFGFLNVLKNKRKKILEKRKRSTPWSRLALLKPIMKQLKYFYLLYKNHFNSDFMRKKWNKEKTKKVRLQRKLVQVKTAGFINREFGEYIYLSLSLGI